jgi:S1-C subfamily serine protease
MKSTAISSGGSMTSLWIDFVLVCIFIASMVGLGQIQGWWGQLPSFASYAGVPDAAQIQPTPRPSSRELPILELDHLASDAVVSTRSEDAQGSAVVVATDLLLTACHVGTQNVVAFSVNGGPVRLRLEGSPKYSDRCLFKTDRQMPHAVPGVRQVATLQPHERVYAYGFPSELPTLSAGIFLNVYIDDDGTRLIQTTARIAPGSSGGALFDRFGKLA